MDGEGLTFIDVLQLMFIYLKLTNQINWNWVLVLIPAILYFVIGLFNIEENEEKEKVIYKRW